MTTGTITTAQIWPNKINVRSHPLQDGIHDEGLDLKATQLMRAMTPTIMIVALSSSTTTR